MACSLNSLAMNERLGIVFIVLSIGFSASVAAENVVPENETSLPTAKPFSDLYKDGVQAYLNQDWTGCVANLENALSEWRFYRKATVQCRLGCASQARKEKPLIEDDIEDLRFSEEMIRRTLCLMKCTEAHWGQRALFVEKKVEEAFLTLKPYEYLQVCYYQEQDLYKAASAAHTVISLRPDDEIMRGNLKFYLDQSKIMDYSSLVNYEQESFVSLYSDGVTAYVEEEYLTAVVNLEKSLTEYLNSEEECRAYCEGAFDQGWFPDLPSSYANHYTFCLKCKRRCPDKLTTINGQYRPDFLPKHYNYLQFAYYKLGRIYEAFAAAASYLLFYPNDESMLQNKRYYENEPSYMKDLFRPREEAVKYVKRQQLETNLLKFVEDEFVFKKKTAGNKREDDVTVEYASCRCNWDDKKLELTEKIAVTGSESYRARKKIPLINHNNIRNLTSSSKWCQSVRRSYGKKQFKLSKWRGHGFRAEDDLGGKLRFSADGFADSRECQILLDLSLNRGITGDGYEGNESPHSEMEHFEGLSLWRLAEMVQSNEVDASVMDLFMEISERGKNATEHYFGKQGRFHFAFSQIACRTGIPDITEGTWMSHKIHADNCQLQPTGECFKEEPAYTSNDYSAIIYLNNNFEGGEFIFSEDPLGKIIQSTIRPKCGRIVGFTAGPENKHGVRGVTKGTRCALGLWFTTDSAFTERKPLLMETIQDIRSRSKRKTNTHT